jgi:NAD(P)-dependent dehydrogenase (short-subunit alcohol dehydrogenase family)
MRLSGKVALVIGAGSGIGQAIALRFAREGARVVAADLVPEAGERTALLAREAGGACTFLPVDVTQRDHVRRLLEEVEAQFRRLDVLVNSAGREGGAGRGLRVEEIPEELWDRVVDIYLSGVFWACKYAVPLLLRSGGGVILNLGSIAGLRPFPSSIIYSTVKAGVVMLSRSMAAAYAREDLRVWALCPGAVNTPLLERLFAQSEDPEAARREYEANEPMGRAISTDEMASLAVYLASDERFAYNPEPFVL